MCIFLIQSVPTYSVSKVCRIVKSLTAREIFKRFPEVREELWGGEFWADGYFVSTVGQHGNEDTLKGVCEESGKRFEI